MRSGRRQVGFSLMEVMFAVAILALGMAFVACQFPVGLWAVREVTEGTAGGIDAHNAAVMTELHLQVGRSLPWQFYDNGAGGDVYLRRYDGMIHMLPKPNWRLNGEIVMDDPEGVYFPPFPAAGLATYYHLGATPTAGFPQAPEYLAVVGNNGQPVAAGVEGLLGSRNLGQAVLPEVTEADAEVQKALMGITPGSNLYWKTLDETVLRVAQERNYAVCQLYRCVDATSRTFRLYTFVLRNPKAAQQYAMQDRATANPLPLVGYDNPWGVPATNASTAYRRFPPAWRVSLPLPADPGLLPVPPWFIVPPGQRLDLPTREVRNVIEVRGDQNDAAYAAILRQGAYIVDGDKPPPPGVGGDYSYQLAGVDWCGQVYRVEDVRLSDDKTAYLIELDRDLEDCLTRFWVVPPAVDLSTTPPPTPPQYADLQPVARVYEQVVRF